MATQCPICDGELELADDIVPGELLECPECGTELEIESIEPVVVTEAPSEEEDWGQ